MGMPLNLGIVLSNYCKVLGGLCRLFFHYSPLLSDGVVPMGIGADPLLMAAAPFSGILSISTNGSGMVSQLPFKFRTGIFPGTFSK
jgi:hypothetical protein